MYATLLLLGEEFYLFYNGNFGQHGIALANWKTTMNFVQFDDHLESTWEEFCERSQQDTFLVTRRFLNYHKDRFSDKSLLIYSKDQLVALFPASEFGEHNKSIVSHPGITFGGLIHDGRIRGADFEAIYSGLAGYYSSRYKSMVVKPILKYTKISQMMMKNLDCSELVQKLVNLSSTWR